MGVARPPKRDKREIREETQLTRPPRMEGVVKEAMMQPIRKRSARKKGGTTGTRHAGSR